MWKSRLNRYYPICGQTSTGTSGRTCMFANDVLKDTRIIIYDKHLWPEMLSFVWPRRMCSLNIHHENMCFADVHLWRLEVDTLEILDRQNADHIIRIKTRSAEMRKTLHPESPDNLFLRVHHNVSHITGCAMSCTVQHFPLKHDVKLGGERLAQDTHGRGRRADWSTDLAKGSRGLRASITVFNIEKRRIITDKYFMFTSSLRILLC